MSSHTINRSFYLKITAFHVVTTLFAAFVTTKLSAAPNFAQLGFGSFLGFANILLIVWSIHRAVVKKSFALVAVTSVFKYSFLIFLFWYGFRAQQSIGYEFIIGVTLIFPTAVLMAYLMKNETNGTF